MTRTPESWPIGKVVLRELGEIGEPLCLFLTSNPAPWPPLLMLAEAPIPGFRLASGKSPVSSLVSLQSRGQALFAPGLPSHFLRNHLLMVSISGLSQKVQGGSCRAGSMTSASTDPRLASKSSGFPARVYYDHREARSGPIQVAPTSEAWTSEGEAPGGPRCSGRSRSWVSLSAPFYLYRFQKAWVMSLDWWPSMLGNHTATFPPTVLPPR